MAKTEAAPEPAQTFESALERLDAIVQQMDSPTLPLHQLITEYEEGMKLVKVCQAKLKDAEQKIDIISRRAQGDPEITPFDPAAKPDDMPPKKNPRLF